MNVLVGLTIILVLMLGDSVTTGNAIANSHLRLILLLLVSSVAPLFASIQVFAFRRKFETAAVPFKRKQIALRRYSMVHSAVWVLASLATVCLLNWQLIVRGHWHLDQFPIVDELVILLPILASLIISWFILFDLQKTGVAPANIARARREYVGIRCRVYLLIVLVPVTLMVAVKDLWFLLEQMPVAVTSLLVIGLFFALLCVMPILIGWMWSNRSISSKEGRLRMLELCNAHRMRVSDIRIWDTGNQIVNALVAGVVPRFRVLMLSDLLLNSFPDHEIEAVLRHEAGHLRLRHLPIRIGFILLPALSLAVLELDPNRTLAYFLEAWIGDSGLAINANLVLGLAFIVYIVFATAWLSKNMEFEADLYAIGAFAGLAHQPVSDEGDPARAMSDALLRFAQLSPDQFSRRSMTHPSLFDRIEMIRKASRDPAMAGQFRRQFAVYQFLIAVVIVAATFFLLLI